MTLTLEDAITILADAARTVSERRVARTIVHEALMMAAHDHFMQDKAEAFERCYVVAATDLRNINVPLLPSTANRVREALGLPLAPQR